MLSDAERAAPLTCRALVSAYDWTAEAPGKVHANLAATAAQSVMVPLRRGRHLLRAAVDRGFFNSISFRSTTDLQVRARAGRSFRVLLNDMTRRRVHRERAQSTGDSDPD